jgi:hypothetical protein
MLTAQSSSNEIAIRLPRALNEEYFAASTVLLWF